MTQLLYPRCACVPRAKMLLCSWCVQLRAPTFYSLAQTLRFIRSNLWANQACSDHCFPLTTGLFLVGRKHEAFPQVCGVWDRVWTCTRPNMKENSILKLPFSLPPRLLMLTTTLLPPPPNTHYHSPPSASDAQSPCLASLAELRVAVFHQITIVCTWCMNNAGTPTIWIELHMRTIFTG